MSGCNYFYFPHRNSYIIISLLFYLSFKCYAIQLMQTNTCNNRINHYNAHVFIIEVNDDENLCIYNRSK